MAPRVTAHADRRLLLYLGILLVFGLVALLSASGPMGIAKFNDSYFFLKRQLLFGLLPGSILFIIATKLDEEWWKKYAWYIYGLVLLLLSLVFIPGIGLEINGSHSWLHIFGLNFQPAELAKLAVIIMLARLLTEKDRDWQDWQNSLLPILAVVAPALLLILAQPDIGTASILVVIIFVMLYLARVPGKLLSILGVLGIAAFIGLVLVAPYRLKRLTTFLHPELHPQAQGYHINQAFVAVGSGGFWGLGYGNSRQKFQYLPEVNADSIYAVIAEEMGFVISAGIILLILLVCWRGLAVAKKAHTPFASLLVSGIMVWLVWQSFLNIGAMVGALPLTGVPLPFVSHGGSALMVALLAMGIVVRVSKS
ncbi:MAG TPA: putative lipid II flippase FtsW [Patescibacteria group bacterium]|nr:putative lipid II flippase FtsW [Patescibacteria group bacterium]